jgi:hypothetical protein
MKYKYRPGSGFFGFSTQMKRLKKRVTNNVLTGWPKISYAADENHALIKRLPGRVNSENLKVDVNKFQSFLKEINYEKKYPGYYSFNFYEKTLDLFLRDIYAWLKRPPENKPYRR